MIQLLTNISERIVVLRDQPILIDREVAVIYGVKTKEVNQAVRNNPEKFPEGYIFQLSKSEFDCLKSKFLTSNNDPAPGRGGVRKLPYAFTEKGLYMLATILRSKIATQATLSIIETFAKVRSLKYDLVSLHAETDVKKQKSIMQKFSNALTDIVMPDLQVSETESTLEINFVVGKIKHTVKRTKREEDSKAD